MALVDVDDAAVRRRVFVLGALIVLGTVSSTLAAFANPPVDEWLYLQVRGLEGVASLSMLEQVRSAPFVVAVAVLALSGWKCRALVWSVMLALLVGLGLTVVLRVLVARTRPFDSPIEGTDSYPSPAILALAILAILVPLCVQPVKRGAYLSAPAAVALWLLIAASGLQEVAGGLRWPLDVAGAIVIGAAVALAALALLESPRLHRRCDGCPWERSAARRPSRPEPAFAARPFAARPFAARPFTARQGPRRPWYRLALAWSVLLAGVLGTLAIARGLPRTPESGVMGTGLELPLHVGLVVLLLVGVLLAARWHLTGAVLVALAAVLLGYSSSVEYAPWVATVVTLAAFLPALLLWVQWHEVATVRASLVVATATSLMLSGVIYFASTNYTFYWGPTHPTSATPPLSDDLVDWMWAGAVTETSFDVRARTADDAAEVRLVVGERATLEDARRSAATSSDAAAHNVVSLSVGGLSPDHDYYYALEVDGDVDLDRVGRISTFPHGPSTFRFAVGADSRTGSNGKVFDSVRRTRPLFYLNVGDFFYGDVDRNIPRMYWRQYDANLTAPAQAALYAIAPIAYTWGDHDFAGNDADGTAVSRPAALQVYRSYVPHYPLTDGADSPIFQAFTVGDVRFVLTDNRSMRDPPGTAVRSMLGSEQRGWLIDELAQAGRYGLVVWANADPWVDRKDPTNDTWAGFDQERRTIADAIAAHQVDNLLMVSGDAHMLAYDDGTNTDYSTSQDSGFPLLQAAALDRKPSVKGGPYTGPVIPGGGQFATVLVRDDGERVRVTMKGRNWKDEVLFTRTFQTSRDPGE